MSSLIRSLNQVMIWMEQNTSEYAHSFLPGLSIPKLDGISEMLGITLPFELYELYKWRNGTFEPSNGATYLGTFHFSPLEEMLQIYQDEFGGIDGDFFVLEDGRRLLPFSEDQGRYCSLVLPTGNPQGSYHIAVTLSDGDHYIVYESLTSMMVTLAECYETGAFYLSDGENIAEYPERVVPILRKYNGSVLDPQLPALMGGIS
jgi:cell wall assembly regulator SMI1